MMLFSLNAAKAKLNAIKLLPNQYEYKKPNPSAMKIKTRLSARLSPVGKKFIRNAQ